ncbi:MAG: GldG family protein [Chloroflexota bacterium]
MRNESIVVTRNHIGQWASYIGGAALLLGIIGFIWQGGLSPVVIVTLVAGIIGIGLWAIATPAEFRGFISGRQVRHSTTAVFATLLLVGIVSMTYVVLARAVITLDMTEGQRFTLSNETLAVLKRVTRPIRITGFYSSQSLDLRQVDDQFFRLYSVETNDLITRNYIDPNEQPALAQKFNAGSEGDVYISYLTAEGSVDFNTVARVPRSGGQERDMSEAIARLLISGSLKVYFETSHGERDATDSSQTGLLGVNNGIKESGLITAPLNIAELASKGGAIPNDASAVILARPTTDFSQAEISIIDAYLKNGGALFIMADALFNQDAFMKQDGAFNQYLWENYGIRALDAVVVDPASSGQTPLDPISAAIFPDNAIAKRLDEQNAPTLFSVARAIEVNDKPPADTPNGRVVMTSPQSYAETDLKTLSETNTYQYDAGKDIQGPLTLVAYAYNQKTQGRIVLIGDSDFATNSLVLSGGNSILFTDALSWLTGFGERINFAPQAYNTGLPFIFISGQQLDIVAFITVILMPGIVLVAGIVVWQRRTRQ